MPVTKDIKTEETPEIKSVSKILFFVASLAFGLLIGATLPIVTLQGLRLDKLIFLNEFTPYLGGVGIGLFIAGSGLMLSAVFRLGISMMSRQATSREARAMLMIASVSLATGAFLASWYAWSYLHSV